MRMEVTIRGSSISFRDARRLLPNLYQFPITAFATARLLQAIDFIKLTTCSGSVDSIFDNPQSTSGNYKVLQIMTAPPSPLSLTGFSALICREMVALPCDGRNGEYQNDIR